MLNFFFVCKFVKNEEKKKRLKLLVEKETNNRYNWRHSKKIKLNQRNPLPVH